MGWLAELAVDGKAVGVTCGGGELQVGNPLALLVHGAGMNRTVWQQQTRYLNHHGVGALAIDLPGHGNSEGPPLRSVPEMGEWLLCLVDEVLAVERLVGSGQDSVALVGHSMGSLACLEAAAADGSSSSGSSANGKVRHLVLAGTALSMPVHPDLLDAAERNEPLAGELITAWGHGPVAHVATNPTPGLWMLGGSVALLDAAANDVIYTDLAACNAYEMGELAAQVRCPVTFIVGAEDKMTPPRAASGLIAGFDSPDVHYLDGAGHMAMNEDPAAVREILRAALA